MEHYLKIYLWALAGETVGESVVPLCEGYWFDPGQDTNKKQPMNA